MKKKDIYGYIYPEVESATFPESSSLKSACKYKGKKETKQRDKTKEEKETKRRE